MRIWLFNDGTYKHRGVWHVAEGEVKPEYVPENIRDVELSVYAYHEKSCSGQQKYVYDEDPDYKSAGIYSRVTYKSGSYRWVGCTCSLQTEDANKVVGKYTARTVTPEHRVIKRQPVLCHQVDINDTELNNRYGSRNKNPQVGEVVTTEIDLKPLNLFEGRRPPGPVCSRCYTAAERDGI